jgi:hypothetical protein
MSGKVSEIDEPVGFWIETTAMSNQESARSTTEENRQLFMRETRNETRELILVLLILSVVTAGSLMLLHR